MVAQRILDATPDLARFGLVGVDGFDRERDALPKRFGRKRSRLFID